MGVVQADATLTTRLSLLFHEEPTLDQCHFFGIEFSPVSNFNKYGVEPEIILPYDVREDKVWHMVPFKFCVKHAVRLDALENLGGTNGGKLAQVSVEDDV